MYSFFFIKDWNALKILYSYNNWIHLAKVLLAYLWCLWNQIIFQVQMDFLWAIIYSCTRYWVIQQICTTQISIIVVKDCSMKEETLKETCLQHNCDAFCQVYMSQKYPIYQKLYKNWSVNYWYTWVLWQNNCNDDKIGYLSHI